MTSDSRCTYKYPPNSLPDSVELRVVFECFALGEMAPEFEPQTKPPPKSEAISQSAKHSKTTLGPTASSTEFGGYL